MPRARARFSSRAAAAAHRIRAVARLGSVTRAAGELHLAQPTVSLQLKKLAETLGDLFEPQGRGLRLTGAGHSLRETCDELILCLTRAEAKLEAFRAPRTERLQLAAEPEVRAAAARLIADFCARHPGVRGDPVRRPEREELLERLAAGADDLYLFVLEIEGLPAARRWASRTRRAGRPARSGARLREAVLGMCRGSRRRAGRRRAG